MPGRHTSGGQWRYYLSVIGYFLPWALIGVVAIASIWVGLGALGSEELDTSPRAARTAEPKERSSSPRPAHSPTPVDAAAEPPADPTEKGDVELITEGMTVQVLNGTADAGADDAMADRLAGLGFDVIAVEGSSINYQTTTVLWSYAESAQAAERLAQRFGWRVAPKPDNLSTSVALHVVVGDDAA
ncbi:MAG: LytR C-terminal domain-containing protein [Actinomycetota bacterium]